MPKQTPSQTVGPFFSRGLLWDDGGKVLFAGRGERITLAGRVLDGAGAPVADALLETWQADAAGKVPAAGDAARPHGYARVSTGPDGGYAIETVMPGAYPWENHPFAWRPAHIHLSLFGNAYAQRVITQMFFPGDPLLAIDPIFNSVPDGAARLRMVADLALEHGVERIALGYRFDIVLRGPRATPMGV